MSMGVAEQVQRSLEDKCDAVLGRGVDQTVADVVAQVRAAVGVDEQKLKCPAPIRGITGSWHVANEPAQLVDGAGCLPLGHGHDRNPGA